MNFFFFSSGGGGDGGEVVLSRFRLRFFSLSPCSGFCSFFCDDFFSFSGFMRRFSRDVYCDQ